MKAVFLCILFNSLILTKTAYSTDFVSESQIESDIHLFSEIVKTYHPGLYRYQSESDFDKLIESYINQNQSSYSIEQSFLLFSKLAASIKCGHTYTNLFNQSKSVRSTLIENANKLPLLLKRVEGDILLKLIFQVRTK